MSGRSPTRTSVVIPAYDEGRRLPALLRDVVARLRAVHDVALETVVVDDGSRPDDSARMRAAVEDGARALCAGAGSHTLRFVRAPTNGGKGSAIRLGWAHADPAARWLGWVDGDGAITAAELLRVVGLAADDPPYDVLAATRVEMAGRRIERRIFRHLQGRVFATLTEAWLRLGVYDTQCGLKLFRADRVRPLLPLLEETGWMLDVELLALLKRRGACILEVPIDWSDAGESKIRVGIDPLRMLLALPRIRARVRRLG
jgi:dolichyl-phosphate beta-glucosyltransferase